MSEIILAASIAVKLFSILRSAEEFMLFGPFNRDLNKSDTVGIFIFGIFGILKNDDEAVVVGFGTVGFVTTGFGAGFCAAGFGAAGFAGFGAVGALAGTFGGAFGALAALPLK